MRAAPAGSVTIVALGDLMLGDSPVAVGYGWRSRYPASLAKQGLRGFRSAFDGADLVFGNLETQLSTIAIGRTKLDRDMMRGDPEYAAVLRDVGVNLVSVANNHAMQHGMAAFNSSVRTLRAAGISVAGLRGTDGWNCEPVRCTARSGLSVGVLGYCLRPRQYGSETPGYAEGPEAAILDDVRRLRQLSDRVLVSLHWGEEFCDRPAEYEVAFADALIKAGSDMVVGHHPHVVRPITLRRDSCVAFSLGNAVSDMTWLPQFRRGVALRCRLSDEGIAAETLDFWTDDEYAVQTGGQWRTMERAQEVRGLSDEDYRVAVESSVATYRRAVLKHMLLNSWRAPLPIIATLFTRKVINLMGRLARGDAGH